MAHGLSTRYVRTGMMNPSNQISVQEMFNRTQGQWLPADQVLPLALAAGISDARIEDGVVVAQHAIPSWGIQRIETERQIERLVAARAKRAA